MVLNEENISPSPCACLLEKNNDMKIYLGSDHHGVELKERIKTFLSDFGYECCDYGPFDKTPVDYPDYGIRVAESVAKSPNDRGILICGSGIGMSIIANKVKGIRAGLCNDVITAEYSRKHNDANILVLGANSVSIEKVDEIVKVWLTTDFEGGRHERRVNKIKEYENKMAG